MSKVSDFKSLTAGDVHYIGFPSFLEERSIAALNRQIEEWSELDVRLHVLDLASVENVAPGFFDAITQFAERLQARSAKLITINMPESLKRHVEDAGLGPVFNLTYEDIASLYPEKIHTQEEVENLLSDYLERAIHLVVYNSLNCKCAIRRRRQVPAKQTEIVCGLSASAQACGFEIRLCFASATLKNFGLAMLGQDVEMDESLMQDLSQEFLNLVFGRAKGRLNEKEGMGMRGTLPRAQRADDVQSDNAHILSVETDMGEFCLVVNRGRESRPN